MSAPDYREATTHCALFSPFVQGILPAVIKPNRDEFRQ